MQGFLFFFEGSVLLWDYRIRTKRTTKWTPRSYVAPGGKTDGLCTQTNHDPAHGFALYVSSKNDQAPAESSAPLEKYQL